MSETGFEKTAEQAAAFQKIWAESMGKILQTAFTTTPNSPPPEILRQIRSGILEALAKSWEEFMRSPQFLQGMRQWMENAITFRKMSNDFMATVRNEMQVPSRGDVDTIMLTVRHMEKRILDRLEELEIQMAGSKGAHTPARPNNSKPKPGRRAQRTAAAGRSRTAQTRKAKL